MSQIPLSKANTLLKEGDILLFRRPDSWLSIGGVIGLYTQSEYSHIGILCKENDEWQCVEFREFVGSRIYPLQEYLEDSEQIDIFRPCSYVRLPILETYGENGGILYKIKEINLKFSEVVAYNIIREAKSLVGKKYGWRNIWKIAKTHIPLIRLGVHRYSDREQVKMEMVCSTLVTWCYRRWWTDLCPGISDEYTTPGDIGRSGLLNKLFSIIL